MLNEYVLITGANINKKQKMCVIYMILRFHKIEQYFSYMHAKFQVAGFQNKRDIYFIVLSIWSVHLLV